MQVSSAIGETSGSGGTKFRKRHVSFALKLNTRSRGTTAIATRVCDAMAARDSRHAPAFTDRAS